MTGLRGVECVMPVRSGCRLALLSLLALLGGLFAPLAVPSRPAQAAPSVVQHLGGNENIGAGTLTITTGAAVPAGHSIVVASHVVQAGPPRRADLLGPGQRRLHDRGEPG